MMTQPNWEPFVITENGAHADAPRSIHSPEGIGDRLRAAAFAEIQARDAFLWASNTFQDAPPSLRNAWAGLALAEQRHFDWIMKRMQELGVSPSARKVSDQLWYSLINCKTAENFAIFIASAEERGRKAGVRFYEAMKEKDPVTSEIFRKIAEEEVAHIALATKYFPHTALRS